MESSVGNSRTKVSRPTIAIIGYSEFSKLMIKHLSPYADVIVSSRQKHIDKQGLKFKIVDFETALAQDIIIPSMPAQKLEGFFKANKKHLNPRALVVDVCSVKVKPVQVLKKILPKTNQILATHPLFGPASTPGNLKNLQIMLYPVRLKPEYYLKIKEFIKSKLELDIVETSPREHDRMMAYVQGLSHYIGRLMQTMQIPEPVLTTNAYRDLLDMKRTQGNDSWELFQSIMLENPYALDVNAKFKQAIDELDSKLGLS